jgi:hypothetical protein
LIKAGLDISASNNKGMTSLDICLLEMASSSGSEIDNWLRISVFLAQRSVFRSRYTVPLLKLQKDPRVNKQEMASFLLHNKQF